MEEIYILIGKSIEQFQRLEENLILLLFCYYKKQCNNEELILKEKVLNKLTELEKKTMGTKLNAIKEFKVFEEKNDISVMEYLTNKRNYIVHEFFIKNEFKTNNDIEKNKKEIEQIYKDTKFMVKSITNMIIYYRDNVLK